MLEILKTLWIVELKVLEMTGIVIVHHGAQDAGHS